MKNINKLRERKVRFGEKWIYSAGFNVKPDLKSTEKLDEECEDFQYLLNSGAKVMVLANQGGSGRDKPLSLEFITPYLSKKLGQEVLYFPESFGKSTLDFANQLKPGQIAILGNVRFYQGEQKNDPELAKEFSRLGEFVAAGGFSKGHRMHASNVGILKYLPGFLAQSQIKSMSILQPWNGKSDKYSLAAFGGMKKEKVFACFDLAETYDHLIPGGIVLNNLLKIKGYEIGDSLVNDRGESCESTAEKILSLYEEKIHIPQRVCVAEIGNLKKSNWINISDGVPKNSMIVDFEINPRGEKILSEVVYENGRILLAGTPTFYTEGFTKAADFILPYLENQNTKSIIVGEDSTRELPFNGTKYSAGGTSLEFICKGTTSVLEALKENQKKFGKYD